jgi:hypothetical protein
MLPICSTSMQPMRSPLIRPGTLHAHGLDGDLRVLHVPSVNLYVMRYTGQAEVLLNGQRDEPGKPLRAQQR